MRCQTLPGLSSNLLEQRLQTPAVSPELIEKSLIHSIPGCSAPSIPRVSTGYAVSVKLCGTAIHPQGLHLSVEEPPFNVEILQYCSMRSYYCTRLLSHNSQICQICKWAEGTEEASSVAQRESDSVALQSLLQQHDALPIREFVAQLRMSNMGDGEGKSPNSVSRSASKLSRPSANPLHLSNPACSPNAVWFSTVPDNLIATDHCT